MASVRERIKQERSGNYDPIKVLTTHKSWGSASKPVLVTCSDGDRYVIKGSQNGHMVYNEYVCGRLGNLLKAPVAWLRFVEIPPELKKVDPVLAHFGDGLALGSLRVLNPTEQLGVLHCDIPQNRPNFAALAILYTWTRASNHQFIYQETPPELVFSTDHGHFFPGGPTWSVDGLKADGPVAKDAVFDPGGLVADDFKPFWPLLNAITDDDISDITAAPPKEWGVSPEQRSALAEYLISRRPKVQQVF